MQRAKSDKKSHIDEDVFRVVMPTFSQQIANDFAKEVVFECPRAMEILRSLAGVDYDAGGFTMTPQQALDYFRMVNSKFGVVLYGSTIDQRNESDIFELWRFFYICRVINARVSDVGEKDGYRHLDPGQDPALVSKARWNDLQNTLWEINTVYRDFLIMLKKEAELRDGLATKRPYRDARSGKKRGHRGY